MTAVAVEDWRHRAHCVGKPAAYWDSGNIHSPRQAEQLCAPCPVRRQCALWASEQPALCGVVVAGVALPEDPTDPKRYEGARRFMAVQNGVTYRKFCIVCHRQVGGDGGLRSRMVKAMCNTCYRRDFDERKSA